MECRKMYIGNEEEDAHQGIHGEVAENSEVLKDAGDGGCNP
jgi:hypothetical protein